MKRPEIGLVGSGDSTETHRYLKLDELHWNEQFFQDFCNMDDRDDLEVEEFIKKWDLLESHHIEREDSLNIRIEHNLKNV